uniref:Transposase n=1 Tax=Taenia asiatica TaxID=60517 RepID=A0A0R3WDY4_TAEAS
LLLTDKIQNKICISYQLCTWDFRVWNDNPDRIVGYVARSHEWSPSYRNFKYVAQTTSSYSLILTGASFFHKVDIDTRFVCPQCKDGLSRKKSHYIIRSACITNFIHSYGYDPLKYSTFIRKG